MGINSNSDFSIIFWGENNIWNPWSRLVLGVFLNYSWPSQVLFCHLYGAWFVRFLVYQALWNVLESTEYTLYIGLGLTSGIWIDYVNWLENLWIFCKIYDAELDCRGAYLNRFSQAWDDMLFNGYRCWTKFNIIPGYSKNWYWETIVCFYFDVRWGYLVENIPTCSL